MIRNTMNYVSYKDRKELAADLKTIYAANTEEEAYSNLQELKEKYNPVLVTEADDYDIEEIIKYAKNLPSINPHAVNPVYLKLPEAMEKNDKRSS